MINMSNRVRTWCRWCKASLTPEIGAVLNEVSGKLDNATLIALNQQVDLQHKDPAAVAEQWVNANPIPTLAVTPPRMAFSRESRYV